VESIKTTATTSKRQSRQLEPMETIPPVLETVNALSPPVGVRVTAVNTLTHQVNFRVTRSDLGCVPLNARNAHAHNAAITRSTSLSVAISGTGKKHRDP